ncbi:MAG: DUF4893 domain-containing protein [Sphingomonadales bacterium]|nr:DUF4893 domain-containing protein [Sphingomonadales bacterium]
MKLLFSLAALAVLSACAPRAGAVPEAELVSAPEAPPQTGWRAIVSPEDGDRIDHLPDLWASALAAAQRHARQIAREDGLLAPQAARNHPALPPGSYHCRLVRIGAAQGREPAFRAFPDFFCHIRGDRSDSLFFTKQTGTELPGGWLHADGDRRFVLTGAKQYRVGGEPLVYGSEPDRDVVGVAERIGPFRWRLVLPWRGAQAGLDVYELTPVAPEQQAAEPPPLAPQVTVTP